MLSEINRMFWRNSYSLFTTMLLFRQRSTSAVPLERFSPPKLERDYADFGQRKPFLHKGRKKGGKKTMFLRLIYSLNHYQKSRIIYPHVRTSAKFYRYVFFSARLHRTIVQSADIRQASIYTALPILYISANVFRASLVLMAASRKKPDALSFAISIHSVLPSRPPPASL